MTLTGVEKNYWELGENILLTKNNRERRDYSIYFKKILNSRKDDKPRYVSGIYIDCGF